MQSQWLQPFSRRRKNSLVELILAVKCMCADFTAIHQHFVCVFSRFCIISIIGKENGVGKEGEEVCLWVWMANALVSINGPSGSRAHHFSKDNLSLIFRRDFQDFDERKTHWFSNRNGKNEKSRLSNKIYSNILQIRKRYLRQRSFLTKTSFVKCQLKKNHF